MNNIDYTIWTDGGCAKNPNGKGGYGVVIQDNKNMSVTTYSKGFLSSTNNRMEVRAIIRALEEIPDGVSVVIYSDSKYAVYTFNGEYSKKKNLDLWSIADALIAKKSNVIFEWVKGHADNDNNNLCDELATQAMQQDDSLLAVDDGFVPLPTKESSGKAKANVYKTTTAANTQSMQNTTSGAMNVIIEPMIPDAYTNGDCYEKICKINAKSKPSFSDFAGLKTNGKDFWSLQPFEALQFYFGAFLVSYVESYIDNEKQILSALRWHGRGLTIENAIRKTFVDNEINIKATM